MLDPTMTYSCGYWTSDAPDYGPADAQRDKLDLICRKLGLGPGSRLLDIGCGWGSLILYAAGRYGARATGVTASERQHAFARARIAERGLGDAADVRLCEYRDIDGGPYDAVSSVEACEGDDADRCATLYRSLRPGGRLLLQQMSRGTVTRGEGFAGSPFTLPVLPLSTTLGHLEAAGLEIREIVSLREHYVSTMDAWWNRLNESWDKIVHRVGVRRARSWRMRLAAGSLAFQTGRMTVHQILAVRTAPDGHSGFPALGNRFGATWAFPADR